MPKRDASQEALRQVEQIYARFAKGSKRERLPMDAYTVRPRETQNGYKLEGERLSHGRQLYRYQEDAISYAKWNSRANGCKIDILCDQDKVVRTEEFSPEIVWF